MANEYIVALHTDRPRLSQKGWEELYEAAYAGYAPQFLDETMLYDDICFPESKDGTMSEVLTYFSVYREPHSGMKVVGTVKPGILVHSANVTPILTFDRQTREEVMQVFGSGEVNGGVQVEKIEINLHTDEPEGAEDYVPTYPRYAPVVIERAGDDMRRAAGPCAPLPLKQWEKEALQRQFGLSSVSPIKESEDDDIARWNADSLEWESLPGKENAFGVWKASRLI